MEAACSTKFLNMSYFILELKCKHFQILVVNFYTNAFEPTQKLGNEVTGQNFSIQL